MLLALDYDGTYTRDPVFWDAVIALAKQHKHRVICVTMRLDDDEEGNPVRKALGHHVEAIVFTERLAKYKAVYAAGFNPSVWIDDRPDYLYVDAAQANPAPRQADGILLALDYDDTYTRDPLFWRGVLDLVDNFGHDAVCITQRHPDDGAEVLAELTGKVQEIIFTACFAKLPFAAAAGYFPSIWVDDQPTFILKDANKGVIPGRSPINQKL